METEEPRPPVAPPRVKRRGDKYPPLLPQPVVVAAAAEHPLSPPQETKTAAKAKPARPSAPPKFKALPKRPVRSQSSNSPTLTRTVALADCYSVGPGGGVQKQGQRTSLKRSKSLQPAAAEQEEAKPTTVINSRDSHHSHHVPSTYLNVAPRPPSSRLSSQQGFRPATPSEKQERHSNRSSRPPTPAKDTSGTSSPTIKVGQNSASTGPHTVDRHGFARPSTQSQGQGNRISPVPPKEGTISPSNRVSPDTRQDFAKLPTPSQKPVRPAPPCPYLVHVSRKEAEKETEGGSEYEYVDSNKLRYKPKESKEQSKEKSKERSKVQEKSQSLKGLDSSRHGVEELTVTDHHHKSEHGFYAPLLSDQVEDDNVYTVPGQLTGSQDSLDLTDKLKSSEESQRGGVAYMNVSRKPSPPKGDQLIQCSNSYVLHTSQGLSSTSSSSQPSSPHPLKKLSGSGKDEDEEYTTLSLEGRTAASIYEVPGRNQYW